MEGENRPKWSTWKRKIPGASLVLACSPPLDEAMAVRVRRRLAGVRDLAGLNDVVDWLENDVGFDGKIRVERQWDRPSRAAC